MQKRIGALKDGYRQNIALTGQSLSGKSSILHHLLFNLKEERIIPVYIEIVEEPFFNFIRSNNKDVDFLDSRLQFYSILLIIAHQSENGICDQLGKLFGSLGS